jgi:hypothetical protein
LKGREITLVYWEARSSQPTQRLLDTVDANLAGPGKSLIKGLETLWHAGQVVDRPCVIVLDQFEQLHPANSDHRPIFELLKHVGKEAPPPHRVKWIVAFRRDYGPEWRDFEIEHDFDARMIPIKLFSSHRPGR